VLDEIGVELVLAPAVTVCDAGAAAMLKSGVVTTSVTLVLCVVAAASVPVPEMISV